MMKIPADATIADAKLTHYLSPLNRTESHNMNFELYQRVALKGDLPEHQLKKR